MQGGLYKPQHTIHSFYCACKGTTHKPSKVEAAKNCMLLVQADSMNDFYSV